jgi:hypothetical protein
MEGKEMTPELLATKSPALTTQSKHYPRGWEGNVPLMVHMLTTVRPDFICLLAKPSDHDMICTKGERYFVDVNMHGAISAIMQDGRKLGLKPDEFTIVAWHEGANHATA